MDLKLLLSEKELFHTKFPTGDSFVWRLLTLKEYQRFRVLRDTGVVHPFILYSTIFDYCLVGDPQLLNGNIPAGIPIAIGQCIMWLSGETEVMSLVDDIAGARAGYPADSMLEVMKQVIFMAWPGYVEEDLGKLTYPELVKRFVKAETLLQRRGVQYEPVNLKKISRGDEAKKRKGPDFKAENAEMERAVGQRTPMLDRTPVDLEEARQRNSGKITPDRARKLDKLKRNRG